MRTNDMLCIAILKIILPVVDNDGWAFNFQQIFFPQKRQKDIEI